MKRTLIQAGAGHPDHPLIASGYLWRVVVGRGWQVTTGVLMEVDVAMCDGVRVRLVHIVDVLLRHDRPDDQARHKGQRDKRAAKQSSHTGIMGAHPRGGQVGRCRMACQFARQGKIPDQAHRTNTERS